MSADSFVIVQTIENTRSTLTVVPHKWVLSVPNKNYDILLWPNKNVRVEIDDASSEPLASWSKLKCRVKRRGYFNKMDANSECDAMMEQSETSEWDDGQLLYHNKTSRITKGARKILPNLPRPNFNEVFQKVFCLFVKKFINFN